MQLLLKKAAFLKAAFTLCIKKNLIQHLKNER